MQHTRSIACFGCSPHARGSSCTHRTTPAMWMVLAVVHRRHPVPRRRGRCRCSRHSIKGRCSSHGTSQIPARAIRIFMTLFSVERFQRWTMIPMSILFSRRAIAAASRHRARHRSRRTGLSHIPRPTRQRRRAARRHQTQLFNRGFRSHLDAKVPQDISQHRLRDISTDPQRLLRPLR